ncbi:hypothetical protein GCK72_011456 [Caenorhabditis remanei]|uniref:Galectin n=1 Tax=Caenorhabditis remanei TaxID=31234 RepID=A0A6A5H5U7_CAERE|nr:hypothetical protein GCK72_011456 [Caenorhabditis remanei]KAF1763190.1 hypothetical protein GCK72_011456 [Caenorhabditis remanei]
MPFRRDINTGCPVGTVIEVAGKPYEDLKKSIFLVLTTNNNDMALRVELVLGQPSKLKIDCTVSQKTSTAIENLVVCPYNQRAVLKIVTLQHSFQIFFNDAKVADFVHRVDPSLVKSILLHGPLITEEVIITPATSVPLPTYEQATSPPVELMANMNLNNNQKVPLREANDFPPPPPAGTILPTAPAATIPMGNGTVPTTATAPDVRDSTATTSSSFYFTGGSQGFSNHPYPLPGLIDNGTYPSQQNNVGHLPPQTSMPSAPPMTQAPPQRPPAPVAAASHYASTPITAPTSTIQNTYTPAPTPSVPYTVTCPQSAAATPGMPQPMSQPNHLYQNQPQYPPGYNPYPQQAQQPQVPLYPVPQPSAAAIPMSAMQPYHQQYMYPQAAPMVQPYPVYQQYPMGYGYAPEVIYYEGGHHHHRHHFFGHHHHHCD